MTIKDRIIYSKNLSAGKLRGFVYIIVWKLTYNYRQPIFRACKPVSKNNNNNKLDLPVFISFFHEITFLLTVHKYTRIYSKNKLTIILLELRSICICFLYKLTTSVKEITVNLFY